jgi:hypothetical protein
MIRDKALTTNELAHRWRGLTVKGTIEAWRVRGRGPRYFKLGKGKTCVVLYKLRDIERFERQYWNGGYKKWLKLRSR